MPGTMHLRYDVEALRRERPIAETIAGYGIELRPSGRALVGRCPFHADRGRPNLHVYPDTQSWYCFRCSVGGDVIDFVRRREEVGFAEACRRLLGAPMRFQGAVRAAPRARREFRWERLTLEQQVVMNAVCEVYQRSLAAEPRALAYLRERGIPDWVVRQCGLGFADGHSLEAQLRRYSGGLSTARELGLLGRPVRGGEYPPREFFAGRIVVPELRGGHCIWFIGRDLVEAPGRPKYLALSGERPVLGLERAIGRREVYLCEGVFDYLTAVGWKLPAFSPCGTHVPADRLGFLASAKTVYGVFDGDEAGQMAAERFGALLGERWHPVLLPDGYDLNDLGRRPWGRSDFIRLLAVHSRSREESCNGPCE